MRPEDEARLRTDALLERCGWVVQYYAALNLSVADGIAVREFPLSTGSADYLLYAGGKAIGAAPPSAGRRGHDGVNNGSQGSSSISRSPDRE